jgi:Lon protease-like protein
MGNEYGYKCKGFELKAVPRNEFEALKRFGDYTELQDGTLMRIEGSKEFRIYCEDLEEVPIRVMTKGFCAALSEAYDCRMKEARELRAAAQNS